MLLKELFENINQPLKAPNGQPSNLNSVQYQMVRTSAFKEWFGDWEHNPKQSSKILDNNGEPLVVYHGTGTEFSEFKTSNTIIGQLGIGAYFTPNMKKANVFSTLARVKGKSPFTIPVFLSIKNPLYIHSHDIPNTVDKDHIMNQGYDGIISLDGNKFDEIVAYNQNQIKSAIGNTGDFSKESDNFNESA
jgi:hypothetical protein